MARSADRRKAELVYDQLKRLVINYRFMPHEPLAITELADRLGVSGTPIREALTRLHAEGLLIWEPGKGFSAKSLSLAEIRNLHDLAFLLLRHAVEQDLASFGLAGLEQPVPDLSDGDGPGTLSADGQPTAHALFLEHLFERIVSLADNPEMIAVIRNFNDRTHYIRLLDLERPGHMDEIARQVSDLIGRLRRGDAERAKANLRRQHRRVVAVLPDLVKEAVSRRYLGMG